MQSNDINAALRAHARDHLTPTEPERAFVSRVYDSIQAVLGVGNCIQIGSYPRFTAITPLHDFDVLFFVGGWNSAAPADPSNALAGLDRALRSRYRNPTQYQLRIDLQTHSVSLVFLDASTEVFAVDIVPAYVVGRNEFGQDTYRVPELFSRTHAQKMLHYKELARTRGQMTWITSDPRGYIEVAKRLNEQNEDFRKTVKFAKAWKFACCKLDTRFKLKSFHLEQILTALFLRSPRIQVFDAIFELFCNLPDHVKAPRIPDRADPSRLIDAYLSELEDCQQRLLIEARDGFLVTLEGLARAGDVPELVQAGLYERRGQSESFLFDQGIPILTEQPTIRIEATVLPKDGFRTYVLDNEGVVGKERGIRFRLSTTVPADIVKWKVRNDDISPEPRGEITDHRTSQDPERTAYDGLHHVEAYAIRSGVCVARARQNVRVK